MESLGIGMMYRVMGTAVLPAVVLLAVLGWRVQPSMRMRRS
jgi:hypothetical protein